MVKEVKGKAYMERREQDEEIARLYQIIENELQKPEDEMDSSLIAECSEFIEELRQEQGEKQSIDSDKTPESVYAKIEGGDKDRIRKSVQHTQKPRLPRQKRVLIRFAAAMVAVLILVMSITVVAVRNGYCSAWEYIAENIKEIVNMSDGEISESGNITLIKNDNTTKYSSIEELIEQEQLDIIFPSVLPDNVQFQKVTQHDIDEDKKKWDFQTNNEYLDIVVYNYYRNQYEELNDYNEYQMGDLKFIILELDENIYQAMSQFNGSEYVIRYNNYDELLKILTGMKGIDK